MPDMMQDYVDVAERIRELRAKHPDASIQPMDPARPYWFETVTTKDGEHTYLVYAAACYRTPDDPRPGIGMAWEPVPGRTSFTRGSELMNAETSAAGRAIVWALAADTKRGVASAQEVNSARAANTNTPRPQPKGRSKPVTNPAPAPSPQVQHIVELVKQLDDYTRTEFKTLFGEKPSAIVDPQAALAWLTTKVEPF